MSSFTPQTRSYSKGDVIFSEGDNGNVAYMIQEGSVNIVKNINDKKNVLATLGPGELFGEMAVLSSRKRVAGAEAVKDCKLTELNAKLIFALLKKSHPTVFHLTRVLVSRLASANDTIAEKRSEDHWMTMCRLLDLECRVARKAPDSESVGLGYRDFCADLKQVINISQRDIDRMLKSAASVKLITMTKILNEHRIEVNDPENFLEAAVNLSKDMNRISGSVCRMDYIDIYDFAEAVGSTPQTIYQKVSAGEFPDDICKLQKSVSASWAKSKEPGYFSDSRRNRKKIEDLESLDDIIFVDLGTLEQVFQKLGYYKLGILLAVAEGSARQRILSALSEKIATAVTGEVRDPEMIDPEEAIEIEDELIESIKELKLSQQKKE